MGTKIRPTAETGRVSLFPQPICWLRAGGRSLLPHFVSRLRGDVTRDKRVDLRTAYEVGIYIVPLVSFPGSRASLTSFSRSTLRAASTDGMGSVAKSRGYLLHHRLHQAGTPSAPPRNFDR